MGTIKRFEEIEAWQTARDLTRRIYVLSNQGAFARDFGLRDQLRRAAVSIMSILRLRSGQALRKASRAIRKHSSSGASDTLKLRPARSVPNCMWRLTPDT